MPPMLNFKIFIRFAILLFIELQLTYCWFFMLQIVDQCHELDYFQLCKETESMCRRKQCLGPPAMYSPLQCDTSVLIVCNAKCNFACMRYKRHDCGNLITKLRLPWCLACLFIQLFLRLGVGSLIMLLPVPDLHILT